MVLQFLCGLLWVWRSHFLIDYLLNNIFRLNLLVHTQLYKNFYIEFIVNSLFDANKYFNDEEPWNKKNDKKRLNAIIYTSLELIRKISILLYPIIPESSLKSLKIFNINENEITYESIALNDILKSNIEITKIDILFNKIPKKKTVE